AHRWAAPWRSLDRVGRRVARATRVAGIRSWFVQRHIRPRDRRREFGALESVPGSGDRSCGSWRGSVTAPWLPETWRAQLPSLERLHEGWQPVPRWALIVACAFYGSFILQALR